MQYYGEVFVTLRPAVLDPAGTAVQSALAGMHYPVDRVRIGKYIEITLTADSEAEARQHLEQICGEVLANPVIETYRFTLKSAE